MERNQDRSGEEMRVKLNEHYSRSAPRAKVSRRRYCTLQVSIIDAVEGNRVSRSQLPRYTGESYQHLRINDQDYTLPPRTSVFVNNAALQCKQEYWGDRRNSLASRPSFLKSSEPGRRTYALAES